MTDQITSLLKESEGITLAESCPSGTNNREEYSIAFDSSAIDQPEVEQRLRDILLDNIGTGVYLKFFEDTESEEFDLNAVVDDHPNASRLRRVFDSLETVTAYGLGWEPDNINECYDNTPNLNLVAPGPLEVWFDTEGSGYEPVLHAIEEEFKTELQKGITPMLTIPGPNAHCMFKLHLATRPSHD